MKDEAIIAQQIVRIERAVNRIEAKLDRVLATRDRQTQSTDQRDPVAALRAVCHERAVVLTGDGRIGEYDAAMLLGRSPTTLRNWRFGERPIPHSKLGGRIMYRLEDLAAFLNGGQNDD
ncbi:MULTISPECIES: helix-turn-helix domain-containing protein [unclassified Rhizobium]|uniref:helix-turn-helix domain-containing protein n=1 Tax=unclassified Rhizobium TaxID=2613769 RepID=UPI0007EA677C|nr:MULTISPECIES: helix-turn-helix domain-containing protein [unclassified Rhizobium]ANK84168.1 hypothetical protein AMK02_CH00523 [Rhizobium sp. N731]ANL14416.1 hypothetical protein AMJ97_CH00523 [Rhizobium sp. N1314]